MNREDFIKKSTFSLGWDELTDHLASHAVSETGRGMCKNLFPEISKGRVLLLQKQTEEAVTLIAKGATPSLPQFGDHSKAIAASRKGIPLEPQVLTEISRVVDLCGRLISFSTEMCEENSALRALLSSLYDLAFLKKEINICLDDSGEIRENATPALSRLFSRSLSLKAHVNKKIARYLTSSEYTSAVQESYHTIREGRYVIPVKAEMRKKIEGIVHDSSATGLTLFIEPKDMVGLNNELKVVELDIKREIHAIFVRLTALVSESCDELTQNFAIAAQFDVILARGKLAHAMNAARPLLSEWGVIKLNKLRHPLLILQQEDVVANDVLLKAEDQAMIISGPNTGGKTVTLKTVGLVSLMFRAGLHVPVGAGSELPLFDEVFVDIGDEQNISNSLSTFSGHLKNIIGFLDFSGSNSLVLLDELMASTNPAEGSALAETMLAEFVSLGARVIITTHYSSLKYAASEKNGFVNACMELNPDTLEPTYKLLQGIPGRSYALAVAKQLGLKEYLIQKTQEVMDKEETNVDELISTLQAERKQLELQKDITEKERNRAELLANEAEGITTRLRAEEKEFLQNKRKKLRGEISVAKKSIQNALEELKKKTSRKEIQEVRQEIDEIEREVAETFEEEEYLPIEEVTIGDIVCIPELGLSGILRDDPLKNKRVRVDTGRAEVVTEVKRLRGKKQVSNQPKREAVIIEVPLQVEEVGDSSSCDLRGLRVEEALQELIKLLDLGAQKKMNLLRVLHGHGTGAIKRSVREHLKSSPYVLSFTPADQSHGGDGVTLVTLR